MQDMKATEIEHLRDVSRVAGERRVRPTALLPLWDIMGFALGEWTGLLLRLLGLTFLWV